MVKAYPEVFNFTDYRLFLSEYLKEREKHEKAFTQAHICRRLGLPNSRSYFGDVLRGQRPLTPSKIVP